MNAPPRVVTVNRPYRVLFHSCWLDHVVTAAVAQGMLDDTPYVDLLITPQAVTLIDRDNAAHNVTIIPADYRVGSSAIAFLIERGPHARR